jgi:hypothetical protein
LLAAQTVADVVQGDVYHLCVDAGTLIDARKSALVSGDYYPVP